MQSSPKVILVTGASSGIGKDIATTLIHDGHIVYGAARRKEKMHDLVKIGGNVLDLDVVDDQQSEAAIATILQEQGRIDVLVNNAGFSQSGAIEEVPLEDARYQFEVNVFGLANITKNVLPGMRAQ